VCEPATCDPSRNFSTFHRVVLWASRGCPQRGFVARAFACSVAAEACSAPLQSVGLMSRVLDLPSIAYIVARSTPGHVIGCDNKVPWKLRTDLRRFREVTSGHVIIMGRKTHESIGRTLPNRINVVISRRKGDSSPDLLWANDRESALFFADHFSIALGKSTIFVIGGEEIYKMFAPLFNKIYLTEVHAEEIAGDAFFDYKFDLRKWGEVERQSLPQSAEDEFTSDYMVFERRIKSVRQVELWRFLKEERELETKLPDRDKFNDLIRKARRHRQRLEKTARDLESFLK
jgi:dihydrofolate reductase